MNRWINEYITKYNDKQGSTLSELDYVFWSNARVLISFDQEGGDTQDMTATMCVFFSNSFYNAFSTPMVALGIQHWHNALPISVLPQYLNPKQ